MKRREPLPLSHVLAHVFDERSDASSGIGGARSHAHRGVDASGAAGRGSAPEWDRGSIDEPRPTIPLPQAPAAEKRIHTRFDKAFLVVIGSELYGDSTAVARNISAGGILVEMSYAPPLGTVVTVHFQYARDDDQLDEIVARAEVKHHHYLNFTGAAGGHDAASTRAIGLRFIDFLEPGERITPDRWH